MVVAGAAGFCAVFVGVYQNVVVFEIMHRRGVAPLSLGLLADGLASGTFAILRNPPWDDPVYRTVSLLLLVGSPS